MSSKLLKAHINTLIALISVDPNDYVSEKLI